ncbi:putative ICE-like protease (caspase) p20 domain protein [Gregarina niphandrodes]|uniref:ICE-like protease (Caspase) p20 domain protein n=1 Tax=Gregarina niphandrodes TaxID=110365 RepID=A0A023B5P8_GRENI|nr:putative ICE-like protease (caspase) p20 domain protein [Gregarina niphandrodes]EZG61399.1 putative ICE-like protease (caspase) p20 domain protein [Gregarina niphandrodes]|eukprot:XP_011130759.1 putative ICE-like protease (caspase) p20 domain protein [Gregarina niphandrodes]
MSLAPPPPPYRRRAVVVGINYTSCGEIALRGCANDAYAFALALVNLWHFDPRDILLLTDDEAEYEDNKDNYKDKSARQRQKPFRSNILQGLKWLTGGVHPGDVLVFYFAGHGLQIDNLSGWEGEGFDEAILPLDCTHQQGDVNAISSVCLRNHFLSVSDRVQLTIFLDCAGGQSSLDVSGGNKWTFIKGVVQKGIWPLTDPTDKMHRARYDSRVWTHHTMKAKGVRPRYVPGVEVNDTNELSDVQTRFKKGGGEKTHAYMICGAPFSEVPVEAHCPALKIRGCDSRGVFSKDCVTVKGTHVYHGAFTWALIRAFHDCARNNIHRRATYNLLSERVLYHIKDLMQK